MGWMLTCSAGRSQLPVCTAATTACFPPCTPMASGRVNAEDRATGTQTWAPASTLPYHHVLTAFPSFWGPLLSHETKMCHPPCQVAWVLGAKGYGHYPSPGQNDVMQRVLCIWQCPATRLGPLLGRAGGHRTRVVQGGEWVASLLCSTGNPALLWSPLYSEGGAGTPTQGSRASSRHPGQGLTRKWGTRARKAKNKNISREPGSFQRAAHRNGRAWKMETSSTGVAAWPQGVTWADSEQGQD